MLGYSKPHDEDMREKIYKSLTTSDLSVEEWEDHAHIVASLGASQIQKRQLNIGSMLLHLKAGQLRFIPRVLALTTRHIVFRAKRDKWSGVTPYRARIIAQEALMRFLDSNCQVCNGVGRIGELGQAIVLCSKNNGGCGGTGKKVENWKGWMVWTKEVLSTLDRWEGRATGGTRRQARGQTNLVANHN